MEHDARILGDRDFVTSILREADKKLKRQLHIGKRKVSIDETIKKFCDAEGVKEEELRNGGQRRKVSEVRAKISFHLRTEMSIPMAEIARHVGVCFSAIDKAVRKLESGTEKC